MAQINQDNILKIKLNQVILYSNHQYKGTFEWSHDLWHVQAISGDYADVYNTNTRWEYQGQWDKWYDTMQPIPYNHNLQANELPKDCSSERASLGDSQRFAREDHVHKVNLGNDVVTKTEFNELTNTVNGINTNVESVESKIPTQATAENQLADKAFVNSSIINMAARYITPTPTGNEQWASLDALQRGAWYYQGESVTPTRNDYAIFLKGESVWRAVYDGAQWDEQYQINSSSFTAEQLAVLNSGITQDLVNAYNVHLADRANPHNVTATQVGLGNVANERQYSKENPPDYPVESVAGKTGAVTLDVADVNNAFSKNGGTINGKVNVVASDGAMPAYQLGGKDVVSYDKDTQYYPTINIGAENGTSYITFNTDKVLQLKNGNNVATVYDSAHQPPYPVTSVNGRTGDVKTTRYGRFGASLNNEALWRYDETLKLWHYPVYTMMNEYVNYAGCVFSYWDDVVGEYKYVDMDYTWYQSDIRVYCPFNPATIFKEFRCYVYGGEYITI